MTGGAIALVIAGVNCSACVKHADYTAQNMLHFMTLPEEQSNSLVEQILCSAYSKHADCIV